MQKINFTVKCLVVFKDQCYDFLFFLVLIFTFNTLYSLEPKVEITTKNSLKLFFLGDIMGHKKQILAAYKSKTDTFDYNPTFKYISSLLKQADFTIGNLELTFGGKPYKGYPHFSSPVALAKAIKNSGINILMTANNHSNDTGAFGLENTITILDQYGILHTGTFLNQKDKRPLILKKNNISIGILNYTYGTNQIKTPKPYIVNILKLKQIKSDLAELKTKKVDKTILFLHWGQEYRTIPTKNQERLVQTFFADGVDIIIGSHPHVLQKVQFNKSKTLTTKKLVAYSLGNFISAQRFKNRDGGLVLEVNLKKNRFLDVEIESIKTHFTWVYKTPNNKFIILPIEQYKDRKDFFKLKKDYNKMMRFYINALKIVSDVN